jgi:hypothetical protein
MFTRIKRIAAVGCLALCLFSVGQSAGQGTATLEKPKTQAKPTVNLPPTKPTTPAPKTEVIPANNVVKLRERAGKTVTVSGKVNDTNTSKSGRHFLRFYGSELTVTAAAENAKKFESGGPAKLFKGKNVEVTGKVEIFKGKLQMQLTDPKLIRIVDAKLAGQKKLPTATLKKVNETLWISPVGLRYTGRDPQGLTRREHVLRHAKDQPRRAGPHGVFDGGEAEAFGLIDAAWQMAQKKKYKPTKEGRQSTYTVSMGYRVGFMGGALGKSKGNPPLKKIFIVFETGTKNIITAFPK